MGLWRLCAYSRFYYHGVRNCYCDLDCESAVRTESNLTTKSISMITVLIVSKSNGPFIPHVPCLVYNKMRVVMYTVRGYHVSH